MKLLITSNFSLSHSVFNGFVLQTPKNKGLFEKGLKKGQNTLYPIFHLQIPGDVVTPGFFKKYMTCEDIFRKPYGAAEMNMFNFAYNLLTLQFKKANQQLSPETLATSLEYLNVGKAS